jgi:regulator of replication initiation timing
MMLKPERHIWEEGSTHRGVAGKEYDEVWDYAEQLEARVAELELEKRDWHKIMFEEDGKTFNLMDWQARLQTELGMARVENQRLQQTFSDLQDEHQELHQQTQQLREALELCRTHVQELLEDSVYVKVQAENQRLRDALELFDAEGIKSWAKVIVREWKEGKKDYASMKVICVNRTLGNSLP